MKKLLICIMLILIARPVSASISITELYPAPANGEAEWIELYNNSDNPINLESIILLDKSDNRIPLPEKIMQPRSYLIASTSSVLNNTGDTVRIQSDSDKLIESVSYPGKLTTHDSYARCSDINMWQIVNQMTPGSANNLVCSPTPTPTSAKRLTPSPHPDLNENNPSPTPHLTNNSIRISEVYPHPENEENEWLELHNRSKDIIHIQNWYIDDISNGGASPVPISMTLQPGEYRVQRFTSSLFNNSTDSVRLLDPNRSEVDIISYDKTSSRRSYGRDADNRTCLMKATPNKANDLCTQSQEEEKNEDKQINGVSTQDKTMKETNDTEKINDIVTDTNQLKKIIPGSHTYYPVWSVPYKPVLDNNPIPAPTGRIIHYTPKTRSELLLLRLITLCLSIYVITSIGYKLWQHISKRSLHLPKHPLY